MLLLGITGRKGSGKDTLFQFMDAWAVEHDALAVRRGFADKLKLSVCRLFYPDCTLEFALEWADKVKNADDVATVFQEVEVIATQDPHIDREYIIQTIVTGRELLQRYGTEAHRDVFGDDFWVDQLLPLPHDLYDPLDQDWQGEFEVDGKEADLAVITDCRFVNEARRIKDLGGQIWEVNRPMLADDGDGHASEKPLPREYIDLVVNNDSTPAGLKEQVDMWCSRHLFNRIKEGSWQG